MRVLYVCRTDGGDNDDEGAIAHALEVLGHTVVRIDERGKIPNSQGDLCLFHKTSRFAELERLNMPKVFWFFDLVDGSYDPSLAERSKHRVQWMQSATAVCHRGFCTDGDWVKQDKTGKLRWLMQGADERTLHAPAPRDVDYPIAFFGMKHHGRKRAEHFDAINARYGSVFFHLGAGGPRTRVHKIALADALSRCAIALALDGPSSDSYWSNRVYLTLGLGGFMLHPACAKLREQFAHHELVTYNDRAHCDMLIDYFLERPEERLARAVAGHKAVVERHLYRHRVEELLCNL